MATLPGARTRVSDTAGAVASGLDTVCVIAPMPVQADITPRRFGNAQAIYDLHGYAKGLEYAAMHIKRTGKAVLFIAVPISTPGAISRVDDTGNSGSCVVTITADADGVLMDHDGVLTVIQGGTIGTDQIKIGLSLDGGRNVKPIRLGTGNSLPVPYMGATLAFGAGTLTTGDTILEWAGSAPRADMGDVTTAREALAAQLKGFRSIVLGCDVADSTAAQAFLDELNAYETENKRFTKGRASVPSRLPLARFSTQSDLTFDDGPKTITRASGSWIADCFAVGTTFDVVGTDDNDGTYTCAALNATVLTTVEALTDEVAGAHTTSVLGTGPTPAAYMTTKDAALAGINGYRVNLSVECGRAKSAFTDWALRFPSGWFASWREYQHDLHVPTWRKDVGPVDADINDAEGNLVEWDDRVNGEAATAARFTSLTTWPNGPDGAFVGLDMTRGDDGSLLSQDHNVAVVNLACTVMQLNAENAVGRSLVLDDAGHASKDSLSTIASEVNAALELALLKNTLGEGQRASKAVWTPSSDDILNTPEAVLTGVLELILNGTIHTVDTTVRVR